ncbi:MAG: sulfatase-like hydrolase/transferase, partial [Abditibacteriales bacterium]|nr:sulfatase-like hydrolase/transferase [Abditibacteriales bacterium]MDW8367766.1 sulfatase-like hydrolase/transferase [Abditibacteriales bacterium]
MKRVIQSLTVLILFAVAIPLLNVRSPAQPLPAKLNVLLITVDDLNNCLGCYGHPVVKSPNIDRLAQRGVRFDRAYCQYPLCNPSRTSFLSGRRPDTTGILQNTTPPRTTLKDVAFLPEYFKQHGYFTAGIGKIAHGRFADSVQWDVWEEPARGRRGAAEQLNRVQRPRRQRRQGLPVTPAARQGQLWHPTNNKDEEEPDGIIARRVAQLMEQNKDKPFFIAAGFHKPHLQWIAPQRYFDLYPPDKIQLPQEPPDDRRDIPTVALTRNANFQGITDEKSRQQAIAAYYACTTFMDAQVGVLLDA